MAGTLRVETGADGQPTVRCSGASLVVAVEAMPEGPRVALGPHASNRDNVAIAIAAIAVEAAARYGYDPSELLRVAREHGLPQAHRVTAGGLILPAGVRPS